MAVGVRELAARLSHLLSREVIFTQLSPNMLLVDDRVHHVVSL